MQQILSLLGYLMLSLGLPTAAAYLLFRFLPKKWIENLFEKELERFKHENNLEVQRLKVEIDSLLNRVIKIQEKEFEALPEVWKRLGDCYSSISALTALIEEGPALDRFDEAELSEFLNSPNGNLLESEKNSIRQSSEKGRAYLEINFWHKLNKVAKNINELKQYILYNSIFLTGEIKLKFQEISDELVRIMFETRTGRAAKDYQMQYNAWEKVEGKIAPLFKEIELIIFKRLHQESSGKM
jgi:hypothetical protein